MAQYGANYVKFSVEETSPHPRITYYWPANEDEDEDQNGIIRAPCSSYLKRCAGDCDMKLPVEETTLSSVHPWTFKDVDGKIYFEWEPFFIETASFYPWTEAQAD